MATFMTKFMSKKVRNFIPQTLRGVLRKEVQAFLPVTSSRKASLAMTRIPTGRTHAVSRASVAQSQGEERAIHVAA